MLLERLKGREGLCTVSFNRQLYCSSLPGIT